MIILINWLHVTMHTIPHSLFPIWIPRLLEAAEEVGKAAVCGITQLLKGRRMKSEEDHCWKPNTLGKTSPKASTL